MLKKLHWITCILGIALVFAFMAACGGGDDNGGGATDSGAETGGTGGSATGGTGGAATGGTGGSATGGTGGSATGGTGGSATGGTGGSATGGTGGSATGGTGGSATGGTGGGAAPDSGAPTDAGADAGNAQACDQLQTCCNALPGGPGGRQYQCLAIANSGNQTGCEAFIPDYCPADAGAPVDGGAATCDQLQACCDALAQTSKGSQQYCNQTVNAGNEANCAAAWTIFQCQ